MSYIFPDPGTNPLVSSTLSASIDAVESSISLSLATSFPNEGLIIIENEIIQYFGKSSNTLLNCMRGTNSTTAASHSSGTSVSTKARLFSTLSSGITSTATSITVANSDNFPATGVISINDEKIKYHTTTNKVFTDCSRGYDSTTATSHSSSDVVSLVERSSQSSTDYLSDRAIAGWYHERSDNSPTLRIGDTNMLLTGGLRLNKTTQPYKFQGYNGADWVDFNATKGDIGSNGLSFNGIVNFTNVGNGVGMFKTSIIDTNSSGNDTVEMRTIQSGTFDLNSSITNQTALTITQGTNDITLNPVAQPYTWDFASNSQIAHFKSDMSDSKFKAWGRISKWTVKDSTTVKKGEPVRITNNSGNTALRIEPLTSSTNPSGTAGAFSYLGVSLQEITGEATCDVCTNGITTIVCGEATVDDLVGSSSVVKGVGSMGIINRAGRVYNPSSDPLSNYVKAGYFLESGTIANDNATSLFYVKGGFEAL